ncbi:Hypothetical predicted protein [Mytilus galloprovincialis]|uniref:EF-hand domain-containing protein n=1 Tax=Mytilus galloprovincialis TaxID=29158 RepID=A0A8B6E159_MYTGA|nr:Hypothetical predicted protein [Mytilus galloprovincialis]
MSDHDLDKNVRITKEEFDKAFSEKNFKKEYRILLFGNDCTDFDTIFQALDKNGDGKIVFRELVYYLESTGISLKDMYLGHTRREVTGVFTYAWHIVKGMHENTRRIHFKDKDVDRTVGINTWYINTTDFDIKEKDKDFMVDQGERSTLKYLKSYVGRHTLPKVSAAELKKRNIPTKTSLRPREIKQILDV